MGSAEARFEDTIFTFGHPGSVARFLVEIGSYMVGVPSSPLFNIGDRYFRTLPGLEALEFCVPLNGSFSVGASATGDSYSHGEYSSASLRIVSATLTDPNGNEVPYRSASGTPYFGTLSYVPEPGTGLLFLGPVGLVTMLRTLASKWFQRNQRH